MSDEKDPRPSMHWCFWMKFDYLFDQSCFRRNEDGWWEIKKWPDDVPIALMDDVLRRVNKGKCVDWLNPGEEG